MSCTWFSSLHEMSVSVLSSSDKTRTSKSSALKKLSTRKTAWSKVQSSWRSSQTTCTQHQWPLTWCCATRMSTMNWRTCLLTIMTRAFKRRSSSLSAGIKTTEYASLTLLKRSLQGQLWQSVVTQPGWLALDSAKTTSSFTLAMQVASFIITRGTAAKKMRQISTSKPTLISKLQWKSTASIETKWWQPEWPYQHGQISKQCHVDQCSFITSKLITLSITMA